MFASIVPVAVIAATISVIDFTLALGLTIEVRIALVFVAISISPLPGDASIDEYSFNHGQIFEGKAASSMGLVVLPIALIKTCTLENNGPSKAMPFAD